MDDFSDLEASNAPTAFEVGKWFSNFTCRAFHRGASWIYIHVLLKKNSYSIPLFSIQYTIIHHDKHLVVITLSNAIIQNVVLPTLQVAASSPDIFLQKVLGWHLWHLFLQSQKIHVENKRCPKVMVVVVVVVGNPLHGYPFQSILIQCQPKCLDTERTSSGIASRQRTKCRWYLGTRCRRSQLNFVEVLTILFSIVSVSLSFSLSFFFSLSLSLSLSLSIYHRFSILVLSIPLPDRCSCPNNNHIVTTCISTNSGCDSLSCLQTSNQTYMHTWYQATLKAISTSENVSKMSLHSDYKMGPYDRYK